MVAGVIPVAWIIVSFNDCAYINPLNLKWLFGNYEIYIYIRNKYIRRAYIKVLVEAYLILNLCFIMLI